ncbi:4'-phosphopantetheinyl transferase family protein [Conservatibacter flavescens]|uniref:4'-phosphopantetheinyl transferase n=1 Tax=Conservatibacter flavescens TaxID=28161 RepID=A0A2M8S205_9PAST|nr:4'-phosphopantetheinyl transferase superfamily protein [Conservatibacter flavescens]PJG85180.1 4'-phosphopantetheinyl transferase [Conservatibacter flavescens]
MALCIAWGNIQQEYPLQDIPIGLLNAKLLQAPKIQNQRTLRRHRSRWVAHFLLWQLLKKMQIDTALLGQMVLSHTGRPYFAKQKGIDFNISHSGDWVAVVVNVVENGESAVGIDIEFPERQRDFHALLAHFSPQDEQDWFKQQTNSEESFYRCWCLREAVLKSQGAGIAKLSEVLHQPYLLSLHSAYCPQGQLVFSAGLPFYLAVFGAQRSLTQFEAFYWSGKEIVPYDLQNVVYYSVNY